MSTMSTDGNTRPRVWTDPRTTPITELEMMVRSYNVVTQPPALATVADILNLGRRRLLKRKNCGRKTIADIGDAIWQQCGVTFDTWEKLSTRPLLNRIALVTGAGGRLGSIWMRAMEQAGATVYGTDLPDDITSQSDVDALVEQHRDIDILVNNAGVDSRPADGATPEAMLAVNVRGTARLIEAFAARMMPRGGGVIVNIASLYGLVAPDLRYYAHREDGWVKDPMYGASKAAIIQLTRDYAARYARLGIRVNALAPGGVVAAGDGLTAQDERFVQAYTARIPMGRMCRPEDLGGPLVFLASDMSSFVTGVTIPIDGGYLCW